MVDNGAPFERRYGWRRSWRAVLAQLGSDNGGLPVKCVFASDDSAPCVKWLHKTLGDSSILSNLSSRTFDQGGIHEGEVHVVREVIDVYCCQIPSHSRRGWRNSDGNKNSMRMLLAGLATVSALSPKLAIFNCDLPDKGNTETDSETKRQDAKKSSCPPMRAEIAALTQGYLRHG